MSTSRDLIEGRLLDVFVRFFVPGNPWITISLTFNILHHIYDLLKVFVLDVIAYRNYHLTGD